MNSLNTSMNEETEKLKLFLINQLTESVLDITFDKVDGTTRTMRCTLDPNITGANFIDTTGGDRLHVWDTKAGGWRTVNVDTVTTFVPVE